jgi:hypothetical protein
VEDRRAASRVHGVASVKGQDVSNPEDDWALASIGTTRLSTQGLRIDLST